MAVSKARLAAVVTAAAVVAAVATLLVLGTGNPLRSTASYKALVGGPFTMTTQDGKRLSERDLLGKPFAVFFGFTQCPDVCPTTMLEVANMMTRLGPDADKMRFLFVTVDPDRDTPALLKSYLASFDKRIIGLVGTAAETERIVKAYRVFYEKVPTKAGYTINHTATMFLMDAQGQFAKTIAFKEDEKIKLSKLKALIAGR
ncbi:MAG: SCO family protein [Hyphomicrobiaceae bacterium]